ncbi:MAG: multiple sugar transport system permease protein [Clostridiales bacterium]|jgi:multiple sugar transport system permease protein|nr:sugar transporter permease [Oscillospiraceae bacterium]MDN5378316.1 multiple sugar transport system permease protein [Clostridiales bacterium]
MMEDSMGKASSLKKIFGMGKGQRILVIVTFMFLPLLLLFVFTYLPFLKMFQFSFYDMKYIGKREWVGLQNYIDVFTRDDCFKALKLCFYYMAGAIVQLVIALYFATVLSFKVKGGAFFKGAMFFPSLICGIAVGFIFKFFYTRGFVLDTVLSWLGFAKESLPYWLKDTSINNFSLAATSVWKYMGQNMVLFIGAIMSVDKELYEAAMIDGANAWNKFRYIILPSIKSIVVLNLILSITGSISAFEPPYVITNGTNGTGTYFVIMDRIAHQNQKVGLASAMAIVLLGILILCTIAQKVILNVMFNDKTESYSRKALKKMRKEERLKRKEAREAARA